MLSDNKARELVSIAQQQLIQGMQAKEKRMASIRDYYDLYNNKVIQVDTDIWNAPFPFLADRVDTFLSKIDEPPSLEFKIPNRPTLSEKIKSVWLQEMSSTRAGWKRKDRVEKKMSLITGRAISKIYASSVMNKYESHYDVVDVFSFIADPTRGRLEDGNYHGEVDIFKTIHSLKKGAEAGYYHKENIELLSTRTDTQKEGDNHAIKGKFDRIKALGIDVETTSFAGQRGINMTEWVMRHEGEQYYLFFDPISGLWARAERLKDVFWNNTTPFTSWATHFDEFAFWTKSVCDDAYPIAEATRFLLNNALENEKRRVRPMRMVESGSLVNIRELQDYVPDNVILSQRGSNPNVITLSTPDASATINIVEYLDNLSQSKSGVRSSAITEKDPKVGIYYGELSKEADRIGSINKEYNESYADKGYNFFWGVKQHLRGSKQVELLGKSGIKLQLLDRTELTDVDDVDDVIVSGGAADKELDAVQAERQLATLKELTASYPRQLNPKWVIKTELKKAGFDEDDIQEALDAEGSLNRELMEEADQAIQDILLGRSPDLNHGADQHFMQRILDFVRDEVNYIKLDKDGNQVGIDMKQLELHNRLMAYMQAHEPIVLENAQRTARKLVNQQINSQLLSTEQQGGGINAPGMSPQEKATSLTRPFEAPTGTPEGTASASQAISQVMR